MGKRYLKLSQANMYRLAGEVDCDWRTVVSVLQGRGRPSTTAAIEAAAKRLGIPLEEDSKPGEG